MPITEEQTQRVFVSTINSIVEHLTTVGSSLNLIVRTGVVGAFTDATISIQKIDPATNNGDDYYIAYC